jgi:hypothetical protein
VLLELTKEPLRDIYRRSRHDGGQVENELVDVAEGIAFTVSGEMSQLRFGNSLVSAHGRVGVDSARAPDEDGDLELGQGTEAPVDCARALVGQLMQRPAEEQAGLVCGNRPRVREAADAAADSTEEQSRDPCGRSLGNPLQA